MLLTLSQPCEPIYWLALFRP